MAFQHGLRSLPIAMLVGAFGCMSSESVTLEPAGKSEEAAGSAASTDNAENPVIATAAPAVSGVSFCNFRPVTSSPAGVEPPSFWQPPAPGAKTPPPISGGTMLTTADGSIIVAADPDRDQLYFVDAHAMQHLHTRMLDVGDEPGRLVEDGAGRIHVVLRSAGAIVTLGREADSVITRRNVCAVPRGIAYDRARDQLHVACAEGKLVSIGAAPSELTVSRTRELEGDLRDVVVRGDQLFVTRFRSAELLVLDQAGVLQDTRWPKSFAHDAQRPLEVEAQDACSSESETFRVQSTPNVAWRLIDVPGKGVSMLHQRSRTDAIRVTQAGYGLGGCDTGLVQTAVTLGLDTEQPLTADIADLTLAVDFAIDADTLLLVVIAPGNYASASSQLQVTQLEWFGQPTNLMMVAQQNVGAAPCSSAELLENPIGQATALTFASPYVIAVQEREPAAISFYDLRTRKARGRIELGGESRYDAGHAIFHARTGADIACASCHPEAGDDAHVWTFQKIGARRTQTLRGGLLGTEPLHWNGDMADFGMLVRDVFVERMSGFTPTPQQTDALATWLDRQPALHAESGDVAAAERGKVLFESAEVRCSQCHAGAHLTNNRTVDVGTGAELQVPSLKGVRFRTPLMHDGCAATLSERFTNTTCGGGDKHGTTSQLTAAQLSDLTAYLETL